MKIIESIADDTVHVATINKSDKPSTQLEPSKIGNRLLNDIGDTGFDLQGILDAFPFYIMLIDSKHHILMTNKAITIALGKDPGQIIGGYCPKVIHNSDMPIPQCPLEEAVCKGHAIEREFYDPDHKRWVSSAVYPTAFQTQGGDDIYLHLTYDITDRQNAQNDLKESIQKLNNEIANHLIAQERIEYLAYHDHLTGLPNKLLLTDRLNQAIFLAPRIEGTIGIMFLDLDNFKIVNDAMGHDQGDELLKVIATRLSDLLRKTDTVARIGGDEFIIMVQNLKDVDGVIKIAGKIISSFSQPFKVNNQDIYMTASIGVSIYPLDGEDVETLFKNADIAMYKAKEMGKNQFVLCSPLMKTSFVESMKLGNFLHRALERNELVIYYQPQVSYRSKRIVGLEALLRWNHPELGLVSPGKFIPIAEQTGLIIPIGDWVLRNACMQNKAWQDAGLPHIRVAVNLSIIQFQNLNIANQIADVLKETGLDPQYLELEITESIVMKEADYIVQTLNSLKKLGITIALDDFGTDYSSLRYLKQLPIDRIKIAMPFVQGIEINDKDEAITKAIIVLAKNLEMSVIAEGVETKQQQCFLTERMCDEMQGFYYYKPLPAHEIEIILKNNVIINF